MEQQVNKSPPVVFPARLTLCRQKSASRRNTGDNTDLGRAAENNLNYSSWYNLPFSPAKSTESKMPYPAVRERQERSSVGVNILGPGEEHWGREGSFGREI